MMTLHSAGHFRQAFIMDRLLAPRTIIIPVKTGITMLRLCSNDSICQDPMEVLNQ